MARRLWPERTRKLLEIGNICLSVLVYDQFYASLSLLNCYVRVKLQVSAKYAQPQSRKFKLTVAK